MATRRWGISQGERFTNVTEAVGAATASDSVELTVDLAPGLDRQEVINALELIIAYIHEHDWPPA